MRRSSPLILVLLGEGEVPVRDMLALLSATGRYGGFSGAQEFRRAAAALKDLLRELCLQWQ